MNLARVGWIVPLLVTAAGAQVDLTRPFSPDAQTVHLFHLDDLAAGPPADAAGGPAGQLTEGKPALGRFGGGLSLDGARGWADFARPSRAAAPQTALTVECWVKFRHGAQGDLICRNQAYLLRLNGGVEAMFGIDGKWRRVQGARPVPVGRWVHLAMTYDQTDQLVRIYLDGRLDVARKPDGLTAGKLDAGDDRLRLGTNTWNPGAAQVDGILDEVRVSSVARTYQPLPAAHQAPVAEGVNLLVNPGFELGLHGWRPDGEADGTLQWELGTGEAAEGRHFLRSREDRAYGLLSYPVAIVPGKTHTFSVALRADQSVYTRLSLTSTGLAQGAKLTGQGLSVRLTPQWQRYALKYAIPADYPAEHVFARIDKPAGVRLDVDAASLVVGEGAEFVPTDATQFGARLDGLPTLFALGVPARCTATLFNTSPAPRPVEVTGRLTDGRGEPVSTARLYAGTLAPGETAATWTMPTDRVGWFTLSIDTTVDGKPASSVPYVVNVIQPLDQRGDPLASPLGMNTHMEREPTEHLARNLAILSRCGVKWIRGWWGWGMAEKQPGQFDWTEFDRQYEAVHAAGMELMPILLRYYPQFEQAWAGKVEAVQQPPYDLQQWGSFVEATVKRYRGRVHAWEVWNEPVYSMDAKTYAPILKVTYERIKAADPQARVVGFAGVPLDYVRDTFAAGAAHSLDVLSHHSYAQLAAPFVAEAKLQDDTLELIKQAGVSVPVWHSEQGSGADGAGYLGMAQTEEACATNLVQAYLSTLATGVEKFFWFSAQTSPTYGWGVFYENYTPRPRLIALNGLARLLNGRTVQARLPLLDGRVAAVLLDGPGGPAAALWNLRDGLTLNLPGRDLGPADLLGNRLPGAERLALSLRGGRPVYLLTDGLTLAALRQRLAQATVAAGAAPPFELTLAPAGPDRLTVTVRNTDDSPLDLDLRLTAPGQAPTTLELRDLAPREPVSRTVTLTQRTAGAVTVGIQATVGGTELRSGTLNRQVRW